LHGFTDADNYSHKVVYPEKSDRTRSLIDLES
jgi:alpha-amylase